MKWSILTLNESPKQEFNFEQYNVTVWYNLNSLKWFLDVEGYTYGESLLFSTPVFINQDLVFTVFNDNPQITANPSNLNDWVNGYYLTVTKAI